MHINPILQPRERARRKLIIKSNFKFQRGLHLLSTILLKLAGVHDVKTVLEQEDLALHVL